MSEPDATGRFRRLRRYWQGRSANVRGIPWVIGAALLFALMGTSAKLASRPLHAGGVTVPGIPSIEITFFFTATLLLVTLPRILRTGPAGVVSHRPWLAIARGAAWATGMICNYFAYTHLPLATAVSINFSRPLFIAPLAVLFLGESFRRRRGATLAGFIGVLVLVRPSAATDPAVLVAVAGALCIASTVIMLKILSRRDGTISLLFHSGVAGVLASGVPLAWQWHTPSVLQAALLAVTAITGVGAMSAFIRGYSRGADATLLAPFDYLRLPAIAALGYAVFDTMPDAWTWVGAALILGSAWALARGESRGYPREPRRAAPARESA